MSNQKTVNMLAAPVRIGSLSLSNRMVMGPMAANSPEADGGPGAQTEAFFEARARGGFGMIIAGGTVASRRAWEEKPVARALRMDIDDFIPRYARVTAAVHRHGVPIIAQLSPGFGTMGVPAPGRPTVSASPRSVTIAESAFPRGFIVPGGRTTPVSQAATLDEIRMFEDETITSAERAVKSGFDGVEVACHMSYLLVSFITPRTNWRTDEYGGSVENRARILTNIVSGIRKRVPKDYVVGLRITANDFMPDGMGVQGYIDIARQVEQCGLDYIALAPGSYETMGAGVTSVDGGMVASGEVGAFKAALATPILFQGIHDPAAAGKAIEDGHGDLAMFARPALADPDFARKVTERNQQAIVRCLRDNLCMRRMVFGMPVRCEVNPAMGRESRMGSRLPPLDRVLKAPVEKAILGLTGSEALMGMVGTLMRARKSP